MSLTEQAEQLAAYIGITPSDWENRYAKAKMVSNALQRPIVFMDERKRYFDEQGNQVVLFEPDGQPTRLGRDAIVLPKQRPAEG